MKQIIKNLNTMKIFNKITLQDHQLGSSKMKKITHYFLFNWNYWTSSKTVTVCSQTEWSSLKQDANGDLMVDEQCEYLGIV